MLFAPLAIREPCHERLVQFCCRRDHRARPHRHDEQQDDEVHHRRSFSLCSFVYIDGRETQVFRRVSFSGGRREVGACSLSRNESGLPLSQEFALKPASADMEPDSLSLHDWVLGGELRVSETDFDGDDDSDDDDDADARSSSLSTDGLMLDSSKQEEDDEQEEDEMEDVMEEEGEDTEEEGEEEEEEEEEWEGEGDESADNSLLLLPAPAALSNEERNSMTTRLVQILRGLEDPLAAVSGEYLARNCSLSRCEDNPHLT